jgi:hypothetical protein
MEISAAAFSTASRSSGRMAAKSVEDAFVRKPFWCRIVVSKERARICVQLTHQSNGFGVCDVV